MNLELIELSKAYPKIYKYGDEVSIGDKKYVLDELDNQFNSPPFGFLFVREKLKTKEDGIITGVKMGELEFAHGEIVGAINISTGLIYKLDMLPKVWNVPNKAALVCLYNSFFPPKTIFQQIKEKVFDFFGK